ncbi:adenylate/guanylate cyclase domain-containing protein [Benzoatithermus flavus]|uniref:Adenylate/guanylate cyclase domain-containing protein n=1 Tax=Benzoatithermus flavus TaxID=3108223 RepID=A0ABU8XQP2_9PROT
MAHSIEIRGRLILALVEAAVAGRDLPQLVETVCAALVEAGVPLARASMGALLLHPVLNATLVIWRRGRGAMVEDTARPVVPGEEPWRQSPFYRLLTTGEHVLRRRLERGEGADELALLAGLAAEGGTDYLALRLRLGEAVTLGEADDLFSSWVSDRPGGFADEHIALIRELEPLAAFVFASTLNRTTAKALLATYLGADAAARVLGGAIERGRAEPIEAVIWYSDLEDFTRLTDSLPREQLLDLLNAYAEAQVDAIEAAGGQILKFMGDGILATFQGAEACDACAAALSAWAEARRTTAALSEARMRRGEPVTRPYLALHTGEVLYGNIGGKARLDFTVLGPAVNETARIAALCRSLGQQAVLSEAFAESCGPWRERLVGLGRYALRGVARPQVLFTLEPEAQLP